MSSDGRLWAIFSESNEGGRHTRFLRICEVASGKEVLRLDGVSTNLCTFSPDGRAVAVQANDLFTPDGEDTAHLVEIATGKVRLRLRGHRGILATLAFSPDGRTLATGSWDTTALLWDLTGRVRPQPPADMAASERGVPALWADLADADAGRAFRSLWALTAVPGQAVPFLGARLRPVVAPDERRVARLITGLANDQFAVREEATKELEELGEGALAHLRRALERPVSAEVRRRVARVGEKLLELSPERLQALRAVEALEYIDTPEARDVLEKLANGAPEARLTREAKASLQRLVQKP
jgi:hypothetical protein